MFSSWMVADHDDLSPRLPASKGTEILSKDLSELSLSENYGKTPVHWLTIYHHVHSVSLLFDDLDGHFRVFFCQFVDIHPFVMG